MYAVNKAVVFVPVSSRFENEANDAENCSH